MANPFSVDHGGAHKRYSLLEVDTGLAGGAVGVGEFTATAAALTTITDASVRANSQVMCFPSNAAGGLLAQNKSCYTGTIAAGSFTFVVSATGAGEPAGTETFSYIAISRS